jgi:hypothetical protein
VADPEHRVVMAKPVRNSNNCNNNNNNNNNKNQEGVPER